MTSSFYVGTKEADPNILLKDGKKCIESARGPYDEFTESLWTTPVQCRESAMMFAENMRNYKGTNKYEYLWVGSHTNVKKVREAFVGKLIRFVSRRMNHIIDTQGIKRHESAELRVLSDDSGNRFVVYGPVNYNLDLMNLVVLNMLQSITKGIAMFIELYEYRLQAYVNAKKQLSQAILPSDKDYFQRRLSNSKNTAKYIVKYIGETSFNKRTLRSFLRQDVFDYHILRTKEMFEIFKILATEKVDIEVNPNELGHHGAISFFTTKGII